LLQQTSGIYVLLITLLLVASANSSKILFLVAFPGHSHWLMFEHVIRELLVRGHEVSAVTNYQLKGNYTNYHEYMIEPKFDFEGDSE
jgi:glucuronosyltransferase